MNNGNLIPFNAMPEERHRELSRRGGKASGAARRAKRKQIEEAKARAIAEKEMRRAAPYLLQQGTRELLKIARMIYK